MAGACAGTSEDCLTLNVYAPRGAAAAAAAATAAGAVGAAAAAAGGAASAAEAQPEAAATTKAVASKAVMVWIHGGCYGYGSSSDPQYDGSTLAATQDLIVVTVNYRMHTRAARTLY